MRAPTVRMLALAKAIERLSARDMHNFLEIVFRSQTHEMQRVYMRRILEFSEQMTAVDSDA